MLTSVERALVSILRTIIVTAVEPTNSPSVYRNLAKKHPAFTYLFLKTFLLRYSTHLFH